MDLLEKGLEKASKVINETADSPNSDKENSVGSSVKQFYGNKVTETSYTPCVKTPPFRPLKDLSSRRLLNFTENRPKTSSVFDSPPSLNGRLEVPPFKIGFPNAGKSKRVKLMF